MESQHLTDDDLRTLIGSTLATEPEATVDRVAARMRVRLGHPLTDEELQRLRAIYSDGYAAGVARIGAEREAQARREASFSRSRPTALEITGLIAAMVPLFVHVQSTTVSKGNVASYLDLIAILGGIVALIAGFTAYGRMPHGAQRMFHIGLVGVVLLLGLYQSLLGLGLLHKAGIYTIS